MSKIYYDIILKAIWLQWLFWIWVSNLRARINSGKRWPETLLIESCSMEPFVGDLELNTLAKTLKAYRPSPTTYTPRLPIRETLLILKNGPPKKTLIWIKRVLLGMLRLFVGLFSCIMILIIFLNWAVTKHTIQLTPVIGIFNIICLV